MSVDNPCYIDRKERRSNNAAHSGPTGPYQSLRQEHPADQDKESRSRPPAACPLAEKPRVISVHQAFRRTKNDPSYNPDAKPKQRRPNPSYNPFIHARDQPAGKDVVSFQSTNPSNLNRDQRESAEKAEARRSAPRKNAPIPSDGDETNTDGESDLLFEDRLLPAQKQHIQMFQKTIRRIRSRDYDAGYVKAKVKAITAAESDRLKGLLGPCYLAGVTHPWYSDQGQAPIHYDEYQVGLLQTRIDSIKNHNTVTCQLEYTANKGGPGGQARS